VFVSIFDSTEEHPPAKLRRYIITAVAFVIAVFLFLWYPMGLRFHKERSTVRQFMNALVAGHTDEAYRIWKPSPTYELKDFLEDWGQNGYYGPIKSYKIESNEGVKNGSSAAIAVAVSPYQPFPDENDEAKQSKTQRITLWVDPKDESISFPPY
jgi:hypothetical protein